MATRRRNAESGTRRKDSPAGRGRAGVPDSGGSAAPGRTAVPRLKALRTAMNLSQPEMARVLGISQRTLSELETTGRSPRPEMRRRLNEVERLHVGLAEVMDAAVLAEWLETPNEAFEGSTPLQLIERGEIDRLWEMVFHVRTGHPM